MWNLGEYRKHPRRLADHLPWAALVGPGVVLNKDGSLQRTLAFRGPDLDSSTPHELLAARARANNVLRRLGSGWCVHAEASRRAAPVYAASDFPCPVATLVEHERRAAFDGEGQHFESRCYLTLTYLPPPETAARLGDLLIERPGAGTGDSGAAYRIHYDQFLAQTDGVASLLATFMPEVHALDDAQTLTYLHACVSDRPLDVAVPPVPFYLDEMLTDRPLTGGLSPRLGEQFLKTVSIRAYVDRTLPCLLDRLNGLALEYRWVGRWLPMDKADATRHLGKLRRQWFAKRKGMATLLKEAVTKQESSLTDSDSLNKAQDVDDALQELGGDHCSFGQFTLTVTVWDEDEQAAVEKARAVQQAVDGVGLVSEVETFNAVQAWLGGLPGHAYADVRRPLLSSLNVCDLVPLSSIWPGPARCDHLGGPPLLLTRTHGSTPFRLSLHQGDVGHTVIAGPTGAGKSTLLNLLACQWLRYPDAQVFVFDKGASCRAMTLAVGGSFHELAADGSGELNFQPLARTDDPAERTWAQDWVLDLLGRERVEVTADLKREVWSALTGLASMPARQRTLTTLASLVQDADARQALRTYTLAGPHGRLLDADEDSLAGDGDGDGSKEMPARWQAFEMEQLIGSRSALLPTLTYLFRRLERRFDGSPTLLVLDEAWLYLGEGQFAAKIREWLKVLRKRNVAVVFATQSLSDIADSSIAAAVIENCLTRIFLPNASAGEERAKGVYQSFGLNARQIQLLQQAAPKRDYYYQGRDGNRLFELGLGELALAFCAAGSPADQARISAVLRAHGRGPFAAAYLAAVGLDDWAAEVNRLREGERCHEQFKFEFWGDRADTCRPAMAAGA
jgi:type IV secretion/conjugal transfer VirB4 family ATPase